MSIGELAAFVSTHLRRNGIPCVLSGGGCVSIYTENRYQSSDLDFIENVSTDRKEIREVLRKIGFLEKNRYFRHPETSFYVEFPSGPLSVGSQPVNKTLTMRFSTGHLSMLSPTDCVKDRLAAYFHWNDLQCLEQARLVSESRKIDLEEIRRWSIAENKRKEFESIRESLAKAPKREKKRSGNQLFKRKK
jgi:hypothetical protein